MNHTYPLLSISENADFILTRIIARIAVPFFLMVTGFFILPSLMTKKPNYEKVFKSIKKTLKLYLVAIILYLPLSIYSGQVTFTFKEIINDLLFNGTFYHLWYLPATIIALLLVVLLLKKLKLTTVFFITGILYLIGLFGDSYYGLIVNVPVISDFYNVLFKVFDYIRNGIFLAPIF